MPIKDKARLAAIKAAWYQKNKERVNAQKTQWKREHRERVAELQHKYAATQEFKDKRNAYDRARRHLTREANKLKNAEWRKKRREVYLQSKAKLYYKQTYGEYAEAHQLTKRIKEIGNGKKTTTHRYESEEQALGHTPRHSRQKSNDGRSE